jgi:hypothetical protein
VVFDEEINTLLKQEDIVKIYQVTENNMLGACRKNGRQYNNRTLKGMLYSKRKK